MVFTGNTTINKNYLVLQQEPRILAHMSGDQNFQDAYAHGKDIYAWCGSIVYNIPYEECLEFSPDGSVNP